MDWLVWSLVYGVAIATGSLGIRLIALYSRTRKQPELFVGIFFLWAPLGALLSVVPFQFVDMPEVWPGRLRLAGEICFGFCGAAISLFTWRVFASQRRWAGALCAALIAGELGTVFLQAITGGFAVFGNAGPWYKANLLVEVAIYGWAAIEPFLYYRQGRRRVRLGLADPVATNRMLLWSSWAGCAVLFMLLWITNEALSRGEPAPRLQQVFLVLYGAVGTACSVCMHLTFFAPRRYLRWVEERAPVTR